MREVAIEELKKIELDILVKVASFCENNNINYYLAYGTLIGAIRHNGFIPWDDDVDIVMPRPDYEKFLKEFPSKNDVDYICLISPYNEKSIYTYAKVINTNTIKIENGIKYSNEYLGVDIDVFPMDGQPENDDEYRKYYNAKAKYYKRYSRLIADENNYNGIKKAIRVAYKLVMRKIMRFDKSEMMKAISRINKAYPYETSRYVGSTSSGVNSIKNRHDKKLFDEFVYVNFEGNKFRAPIGYDKVLKDMFGDYMQLPPENERVTHHGNKVYIKENIKNEKI